MGGYKILGHPNLDPYNGNALKKFSTNREATNREATNREATKFSDTQIWIPTTATHLRHFLQIGGLQIGGLQNRGATKSRTTRFGSRRPHTRKEIDSFATTPVGGYKSGGYKILQQPILDHGKRDTSIEGL